MTYGIDTQLEPVDECTLCPGNYQLPFEPATIDGVEGYAIPESTRVGVAHSVTKEMRFFRVPLPFTVRLVALGHDMDADLSSLIGLLGVAPGVQVDDSYEIFRCNRQPERHPHITIAYGREWLAEGNAPKAHNPPLAVHRARQRVESLPPDKLLAEFWSIAQRHSNPITVYHNFILAWKPPVRPKRKRR